MVLFVLACHGLAGAAPKRPAASAVLAKVGDVAITVGQFEPIMLGERVSGDAEGTRSILFSLIRAEALAQETVRRGYAKHGSPSNEEIQRFLSEP